MTKDGTPELTILTGHRHKRVVHVAIAENDNSNINADDTIVAYGEYDGGVRVAPLTRESADKKPSKLLLRVPSNVMEDEHDEECALAFSPNGRTLASATVAGVISLWTI